MAFAIPRKVYYVCPKCGKIAIAKYRARVRCREDKIRMPMIRLDPFHLKILANRLTGDLDLIPPIFFIKKQIDEIYMAIVAGFRLPVIAEEYAIYYVHPTAITTFKEFIREKYVEKKPPVPEAKPPTPPSPAETLKEVTEEVAERIGIG